MDIKAKRKRIPRSEREELRKELELFVEEFEDYVDDICDRPSSVFGEEMMAALEIIDTPELDELCENKDDYLDRLSSELKKHTRRGVVTETNISHSSSMTSEDDIMDYNKAFFNERILPNLKINNVLKGKMLT